MARPTERPAGLDALDAAVDVGRAVAKTQGARIQIGRVMTTIYVDFAKADRELAVDVKNAMTDFVLANFAERKWLHAKAGKARVWHTRDNGGYSTGMRMGLELKRNDEESTWLMWGCN